MAKRKKDLVLKVPDVVTLFMVGGVERRRQVRVGGAKVDLELTWADGMIGVVPVFSSKAAALKYAGGANKAKGTKDAFQVFTFDVVKWGDEE